MKKAFLVIGLLFFVNSSLPAQEAGNRVYGNRSFNSSSREPTTNSGSLASGVVAENFVNKYSIEASVLINLKADTCVAVFGVQQEAKTANESNEMVNRQIEGFIGDLKKLGIADADIFVDFITQNRIYDFKKQGADLIETLTGFETKKTVAVRYKNRDLFEKLVTTAADRQIFDLIKVDYLVTDLESVQNRLFEEAARIVDQKKAKYEGSFNVALKPIGLENEKYDALYPSDRYQSYQAYETGTATSSYRSDGVTIRQRKTATYYYEPVDDSKFDKVLTPKGIEPVIQVSLYLRMNYLTLPKE
jgi:uncharacterized protein YggE